MTIALHPTWTRAASVARSYHPNYTFDVIEESKWPKLRVAAEEAARALDDRLAEGDRLSREKIVSAPQLERLLDRAARWREDNQAILMRLFDASAASDYQKQEWEDLFGQEYAEHFILRRIRELITQDRMYLTVLRSYLATDEGREFAQAPLQDVTKPKRSEIAGPQGLDINGRVVDVFVSHSSADALIAKSLVSLIRAALLLRSEQIRCTSVEGYKLPAGAITDDQLRVEIFQANAFVGLVTTSSMESAYVLFELGARWLANKQLIPLLAAGATPTSLRGPLGKYNALRCTSAADLHQLLRDLATHLNVQLESASAYQRELDALIAAASATG